MSAIVPRRMPAPICRPHGPPIKIVPAIIRADAVAGRTADGDQAAPHGGAKTVAGIAIDEQFAAGHAARAARISRARMTRAISVNADLSTVHLSAEPVACVARDFDSSAAHFRSEMPASVAFHANRAFGHSGADAMNARQIARQMDCAIRRIAGNGEQLGQRQLLIAAENLDALDLSKRQSARSRGTDPREIDRKVRGGSKLQEKRHNADNKRDTAVRQPADAGCRNPPLPWPSRQIQAQ